MAKRAGISTTGLNNIETGSSDSKSSTLKAIRAALEGLGVEFTNGEGPGVKLRKAPRGDPAASIKVEDLTAEND